MAIIDTITWDYHFANWVQKSDTYKNNFTFEGAKALQEYLDQLSDDIGEDIEFDPVAWCCEFSEYKDFAEFKHDTGWTDKDGERGGYPDIKNLDDLRDNTTVIEFDGGLIVQDF